MKQIWRGAPEENGGVFCFKILRKYKGNGANPAREARRGIFGGICFKYKGNTKEMEPIRRAKRAGKTLGAFASKYKGNTKEMKQIRRAKRAGGILGVFCSKYKGDTKEIRRAKRTGIKFGVK